MFPSVQTNHEWSRSGAKLSDSYGATCLGKPAPAGPRRLFKIQMDVVSLPSEPSVPHRVNVCLHLAEGIQTRGSRCLDAAKPSHNSRWMCFLTPVHTDAMNVQEPDLQQDHLYLFP